MKSQTGVATSLGFTPRTGQVTAALLFAMEGLGVALVPNNVVPGGWIQHTRRIGPGAYREIVAYSRSAPTNWPNGTGTYSSPSSFRSPRRRIFRQMRCAVIGHGSCARDQ
ncbi:hypothetical protein [Nocardia vinacea]|uniref:hypothetical protein n=1 Tax=Nocardia vinacea TaxID=96468 RepID=UPI0003034926|nr:hypothetical protein [Nocardia vinacea]